MGVGLGARPRPARFEKTSSLVVRPREKFYYDYTLERLILAEGKLEEAVGGNLIAGRAGVGKEEQRERDTGAVEKTEEIKIEGGRKGREDQGAARVLGREETVRRV